MGLFDWLRDNNPFAAPNPYRPNDMQPPPLLRRPMNLQQPRSAQAARSGTAVYPQSGGQGAGQSAPSYPNRTPRQDPYAAALARQRAEQAAAMARAGKKYQSMAGNLDPQIAALRAALDKEFKKNLDQNLADVGQLIDEQTGMLKDQAEARGAEYRASGKNNTLANAAQQENSIENLVRERSDTLAGLVTQGAGQSDMLRAMVASARNWRDNTDASNRDYYDTLQSINQGITESNLDTQTSLANVFTQGESERERLWQDYYNRRSETYTQLGNLYQQQADYLDLAEENKVGSGGGTKKTSAGDAFMKASRESGKSYVKQGLPDWISDYEGQKRLESTVTNNDLAARMRFQPIGQAQGATSRSLS
jgi:hypothetical protein